MDRERFTRIVDNGKDDSSVAKLVPISSSPSEEESVDVNSGASCILHTVSKFDTLAGVAIKYGVEVVDIKRLNGLVTDLQMFARKTLQIPLPGRHPPSPNSSNGPNIPPRPSSSQLTLSNRRHSDLFDSFPSLKLKLGSEQSVPPSMSSLQSYYGLKPAEQKGEIEGFEMAVYQKGGAHYCDDGSCMKISPISDPPQNWENTADLLASEKSNKINQVLSRESKASSLDKSTEKTMRRRQKSEADFTLQTPEKILKEENTITSTISAIIGKGLALRPKSATRAISEGGNGEAGSLNPIPIGLGDSLLTDNVSDVPKSSSFSYLLDSENSPLSSIWSNSKWNLKSDFQVLSSVAIAKPILDGLAKPISRRNKAAVD